MPTDFILPELGENITSGDVLRVLVKPGDKLAKNQPILELETDKATIEVPSSVEGEIAEVKIKAGETVKVGQAILTVVESAGAAPAAAEPAPAKAEAGEKPQPAAEPAPKRPEAGASKKAARPAPPPPDPAPASEPDSAVDPDAAEDPASDQPAGDRKVVAASDTSPAKEGRGQKVVDINRGTRSTSDASSQPEQPPAPAAPSVRRMARELGVDIHDVAGSGAGGRISVDDVKTHVNRLVSGAQSGGAVASSEPLPDFTRWGAVDRQPLRGVRRKTAQHLAAAWASIPHVTQHDLADITALEELRKQYAKTVEAAGGSLTVTAILVKVLASALKRFPQLNSSIDMAAEELVYKKYVNIGIAVDTDHGLLVPVIRDADAKSITDISVEIKALSEKARARKLTLEEMQGGCFSLSNLGGIGGTAFTPIVNAPEVAILGVSRARLTPVYRDAGQLVPRLLLPLSLSYDHRVVDGAEGIRFLRWVVEALEQPFLLVLQG
jgi:pyruvate dehydrogenase E2 component (dihydrolipoamide acetyltransferase)